MPPLSTVRRAVALCVLLFAVTASPAFAGGEITADVSGAGAVSGPGISCQRAFAGGLTGDCNESFGDPRECIDNPFKPLCIFPPIVNFTASPAPGFAFDGWAGDCADQGAVCALAITGRVKVIARFRDVADPAVALGAVPVTARGTLNVTATATDNAAVDRVVFTLGGATVTDKTAPYSASFNTANLKDGAAKLVATAVDVHQRSKGVSVGTLIDNTAPTVDVSGPNGVAFGPGATPTWTIAAADAASGVKSVVCSLDAGGFKPCGSTFTAPERGHGNHALAVRVTDNAGNSRDVVRTYAIDAVAPVTTIGSGVADGAVVADTTLTWAFGASEPGVTFACRVYPAALTPGAFAPCSAGSAHTAAGFAPGVYTFEVQATDAVGNVEASSVKRTFTIVPAVAGTDAPGLNAAGKSAPQIRVTVTFTFSNSTKKQTKLTSLVVRGVPAGATVSAKGFKKKNAKGNVSLKKILKKPYKTGAKIVIRVSKPGMGTAIKTLTIRARKTPVVSTRCQPPGAAKPTPC